MFFTKYIVLIDFSSHFCDFSRVPIEDFRKFHVFEPCSDTFQETIRENRHRFSVIFTDPKHFLLKILQNLLKNVDFRIILMMQRQTENVSLATKIHVFFHGF